MPSPTNGMHRRIRRTNNTPMPLAWACLCHEWWGVDRQTTWQSWQGIASCPWTEVVMFRQKLLLWPTVSSGHAAAVLYGVTPQDVLHVIELVKKDRRVSPGEARTIEEHILAHVSRDGAWKE